MSDFGLVYSANTLPRYISPLLLNSIAIWHRVIVRGVHIHASQKLQFISMRSTLNRNDSLRKCATRERHDVGARSLWVRHGFSHRYSSSFALFIFLYFWPRARLRWVVKINNRNHGTAAPGSPAMKTAGHCRSVRIRPLLAVATRTRLTAVLYAKRPDVYRGKTVVLCYRGESWDARVIAV